MKKVTDIIFTFTVCWLICFAAVGLLFFVPLRDIAREPYMKLFISNGLIKYQKDVTKNFYLSEGYIEKFVAFVGCINELFRARLREISLIAFAYCFSPTLQGIVYEISPGWLIDLPDQVTSFVRGSDSEPPDLEDDPAYLRAISQYEVVDVVADFPRSPTADLSAGVEPHIFDEVFGVIPQVVQELWKKQEREAMVKKESLTSERRSRVLPPVRFSPLPSPEGVPSQTELFFTKGEKSPARAAAVEEKVDS